MTAAEARALRKELERRFVTVSDDVELGGRLVRLMRPVNPEALINEDDFERDERLPYWADLWPSARVLADTLVGEPGKGRTLLELGCGLGWVAIGAIKAGFTVTATDYYEDALQFTRVNTFAATGRAPHTRHVDWRALPTDLGTFDSVVAADVLYERPYATLVADAIARALARGGEAIVTDPGRVAAGHFLDECRSRGLDVTTHVQPWREGTVTQRILVHRLRAVSSAGS